MSSAIADDVSMSSSDGSDSPGSARRQSHPSAHSPTMRGWHLGNEAAARRTAALQAAHRSPLTTSQRLKIVHYIDDTYGKAAVPFKDVAEHFHRSQGTMTGLWKGRHDLEPRRPGPHPAPVVFHPPRKDAPTSAGENSTQPPRPTLQPTLLECVNGALNTLNVAVRSVAEDELGQAILAAADRNVHVKVYLDFKHAYADPKWPRLFIASNMIEVNYRKATCEKMNLNYVVADLQDVCGGSADFSDAALLEFNEEFLLHLRGRRATNLFVQDFTYRWKTDSKCLLRSKLEPPTSTDFD